MNEDQIEVVEKCANEISQLIEMFSDDFNYQKYLNTLNRCEADKYISRVKPHFFDEDTNEMLDPELFILNKSQKNQNLNKVNVEEDEEDIFYKPLADIRIDFLTGLDDVIQWHRFFQNH